MALRDRTTWSVSKGELKFHRSIATLKLDAAGPNGKGYPRAS